MRLVKALLAVVFGLVVLLAVTLVFIPTERLATLAAQQFEAATGRSLTIGGEVGLSVYPVIGATAQDISIGNPDWAGEGDMLRAEEMDVGLNLMRLLSGTVAVERVVLQSPMVLLRRAADGRATWEFGSPEAAEPAVSRSGRAPALTLARAEIRNGSLRYVDDASGMDLQVTGLDATMSLPAMDGPLSLDSSAQLNGQPVSVTFRAGNAGNLLNGGLTAIELEAELAAAEARFEGRLSLADMAAEGQVSTLVPALAPVMDAIGQSGSELPANLRPLTFSGQLTHTASGQVFLRDGAANLGDIALTAAADIALSGSRPRVDAQVTVPVLDLRGGGGGAAPQAEAGWSRDPIDASALSALDGDISISLNELRSDSGTFGPIRLRSTIDNARAVTDIREARLFGGGVTGQVVVNNRAGLSARADLQASDISLLQLLRDTAGFERLEGTAEGRIDLLGSGNSLHAIMNSLRGEGALSLSEGEILGLDLAGMLRNLDLGYVGEGTRTIYNSITGSFTVADGVLRNDDLLLDSPRVQVAGEGQIGLGTQTLDYRLVPSALRDEEGNALRVPLMVTGPWSAPRFRLDMEALARERLAEERERLEALAREEAQRLEERARAEAEAKIADELGVTAEEGETLEDTLRRGVEQRLGEEIGQGLRGLFGGN